MLKPEDVRRFRGRLEAQRDELEARILANRKGVQENIRNEDGVGDLEEDADLIYDREFEIDQTIDERAELEQVKHALERIDRGTYGVSEVSGKPIPIERLEALPYATTLAGERPSEPE